MSRLFALGSNSAGQLGVGHKQDVSTPTEVLFHPKAPLSPVTRIVAGGKHTLLLTQSGTVFCCGDLSIGACGPAFKPDLAKFQQLCLRNNGDYSPFQSVSLIAATWQASFIAMEDDRGKTTKLFSLGAGLKGELGLGQGIHQALDPAVVTDFPPVGTEIVDLAAGLDHVVAILSNGDAYGWGNNRKSQFGSPPAFVYSPRRIKGISFKAFRALCARETACIFGEAQSRQLQLLGSNKWNLFSAAPVNTPSWIGLGAGWSNIFVLQPDGGLLAWGRNDHSQLPPSDLPRLKMIAVGSEHSLALTIGGEVVSWGWGEHGNCGKAINSIQGHWSTLPRPPCVPSEFQITCLGSGCATSWMSYSDLTKLHSNFHGSISLGAERLQSAKSARFRASDNLCVGGTKDDLAQK